MNRFFLVVLSLFFVMPCFALEKIPYKNLKNGAKITFSNGVWDKKTWGKPETCYVKKNTADSGNYSEYYTPSGEFVFSTDTQYEFINKGALIGYNNQELKFYEFTMSGGVLGARELLPDEVSELFPKYKLIKITDFSQSTNSLKFRKKRGALKAIVLNDTDRYFNNYAFTTNNAKFEEYELKGFLKIKKSGMIQLSKFGENSKGAPWFILLVR